VKCSIKGKYPGSTRNALEFEGNLLSLTSYKNCPDSDWQFHKNSSFTFVLNGGWVETRECHAHECKAGDVLFYDKGIIHKNSQYLDDSRHFNLELSEQWLRHYDVPFNPGHSAFVLKKCDIKFLFIQLYREFLDRDRASALSLSRILLQIIGHVSHELNERKKPAWVPEIRELLVANWSDNFSLHEIAATINIHPVTISKNFTRYFGCTLGEFIRKYRIEKALTLIRTTDRSLTDIALTCGFADQSHFTRNFKKLTGSLPLHYRKI
jgi:AraC family transcriptional regulator